MTMQQRLDRWEARAEWPLASVAAVFLTAYSVEVLVQPHGLAARLVDLAIVAEIGLLRDELRRAPALDGSGSDHRP